MLNIDNASLSNNIPPDTTKPTITFTSPASFSTPFSSGPNIAIQATDAESGVKNTVLHVYNADNTPAKFCPVSNTATTSCDTSTLPEGEYYVKAGANDNAGNNRTVTEYFTIDKTKPNVNVVNPANGSANQGAFTVSGTASDNIALDRIEYTVTQIDAIGGNFVSNVASGTASGTTAWSFNASGLGNGFYRLKVQAFDEAGNWRYDYNDVQVDNTKPTVSVVAPSDGAVLASGNFSVDGTASDAQTSVTEVKYTITQIDSIGGSYVSNITSGIATGTTSWTFNLAGLADGFYRVKVQAFDEAGNWRYDYNDVQVDSIAPVVTINSYSALLNVITPSVTATDPTPGSALTYSWAADNTASANNVSLSDASSLEPNFTVLSDGTYSFSLTVTDEAGNSTNASFGFTYTTPVINNPELPFNPGQAAAGNVGGQVVAGFTDVVGNALPVDGDDGVVLGVNTDEPNAQDDNDGEVKGTSTNSNKDTGIDDKSASSFLGLGWWWIPILVVATGIIYWVVVKRSDSTSSSS